MTITKTFNFPNSSGCVELYYKTYKLDTMCYKVPKTHKTSTKTKKVSQEKLYKNYVTSLNTYMKQHRSILYYNTDIANYRTVLDTAKKMLQSGYTTIRIDDEIIPLENIERQFVLRYQKPILAHRSKRYIEHLAPIYMKKLYIYLSTI